MGKQAPVSYTHLIGGHASEGSVLESAAVADDRLGVEIQGLVGLRKGGQIADVGGLEHHVRAGLLDLGCFRVEGGAGGVIGLAGYHVKAVLRGIFLEHLVGMDAVGVVDPGDSHVFDSRVILLV